MANALVMGLTMGLAAGISPGPLLALVVTATLRSGWRAGVLTAAAPLVTDALVVTATLLVLDAVPARALATLGVAGSVFVVWTGIGTVRQARGACLGVTGAASASSPAAALRRATLVNLLSPHPWVFWATALGPLVVDAWLTGPACAVALVGGFYLALVGAKAVVAVLVAGGRRRLRDAGYRAALAVAGVLLVLAGLVLAAEFLPDLW